MNSALENYKDACVATKSLALDLTKVTGDCNIVEGRLWQLSIKT